MRRMRQMRTSRKHFKGLDAVAEAITDVRVVGEREREVTYGRDEASTKGGNAKVAVKSSEIEASLGASHSEERTERTEVRVMERGPEHYHVEFGSVARALTALMEALPQARLWILLDDWSVIPLDLQPLLADMLRRALFPVRGLTVKIAAIEQRSQFQVRNGGSCIGIELGADASAALDLDDFMVFGNDEEKSKQFFSSLLYKHV